jgi:hypothetical protein
MIRKQKSDTPVLFIIFNRPESVQRVFNEIKRYQPEKLYVHADGPRPGNFSDEQKCLESRNIIKEQVDWDCDLKLLFRNENLGCGKGPASAISWFFENVEEGIIIEEDCLPHPDFFGYCSELLQRYRYNEKIMIIGATTYHDDYPCKYSYTFTNYGTMAAWATWKRVWDKFDYSLSGFSREELMTKLRSHFYSRFEYKNWLGLYDWIVKDKFLSYWDWQLHFVVFYHQGIAIRPKKNMISNFGVGPDATHTNYESGNAFKAHRPVFGCLPLSHPPEVNVDKKLDAAYYKRMYRKKISTRILEPLYNSIFLGRHSNNPVLVALLRRYRKMKNRDFI